MCEIGKIRPVEIITGMGKRDKGKSRRSECNYDIFDIL
jgi:hypothetical protein